jgi:NAD(P)-dependent dehydrogenase (short-subunit alcohol dehydrogenase family)
MSLIVRTLFVCVLVVGICDNSRTADTIRATSQKAVLITGASTGIGRKATELLAEKGYLVYAGARKPEDIESLNQIKNVRAVRLDVTVQEEIDAAVKVVEKGGHGLYGVVNNAGVNVLGPLIEIDESELDFLFDVNIYGPYRITKAFAPFIIESKGRIVNISSISGTLSGGLYGVYAMSKHALEAYTDALAMEMSILGVRVIGIEPGNFKTNIFHNRCDRTLATGYDPKGSYWEQFVTQMVELCKNRPEDTDPEPDLVAEAIHHALFDDDPKDHYLVVPEQQQAMWTIYKAIEELLVLNEDQPFSYTRDELVEMLDKELEAMRSGSSMVPGPPRN